MSSAMYILYMWISLWLTIIDYTRSLILQSSTMLVFFYWKNWGKKNEKVEVGYLQLASGIDRMSVDFVIVDGADEFQTSVITKGSPFRVDDHLARIFMITIPRLHFIQVFYVAGVRSRSYITSANEHIVSQTNPQRIPLGSLTISTTVKNFHENLW